MLEDLTPASFAPHTGTEFLVDVGGGSPLPLTLASVDASRAQPGVGRAEPFSLLFVGPPQPILSQRIHRLEHPAFGALEVFLVPVGPGPEGPMRYEAVFN